MTKKVKNLKVLYIYFFHFNGKDQTHGSFSVNYKSYVLKTQIIKISFKHHIFSGMNLEIQKKYYSTILKLFEII